ncbi:MAG: heme exporter protein CcmB [Gemmatimonadota bacterium]|nr:heme exporter protein CcmB [Gemmatimonadota bacterium]
MSSVLAVEYRQPGFVRDMLRVARKDLVIEFRTRSAFLAAGVFSLLSVAIFKFTWEPASVTSLDVAPGVLWVIFTFSGLLGLHRSFGVELADRALDALLSSPMSRESVFAGKALANLAFVSCVQATTIPAIALFFDLPAGRFWYIVVATSLLASVGLVAVGTLFAAVTANTRLAELLLPMLALPFFIPVVIPAAQATSLLLNGRPFDEAWGWLRLLMAFDIIFVAACTVAFPYTLEE